MHRTSLASGKKQNRDNYLQWMEEGKKQQLSSTVGKSRETQVRNKSKRTGCRTARQKRKAKGQAAEPQGRKEKQKDRLLNRKTEKQVKEK